MSDLDVIRRAAVHIAQLAMALPATARREIQTELATIIRLSEHAARKPAKGERI
jgi:hypothetical protein